MVLVALALRLAAMTLIGSYQASPHDGNFSIGWESGRIGRSLGEGQGFSSPFEGRTGPTAWMAPLYPFLIAIVFKVLGVYSYPSVWALLALNCLFSALTCLTIHRIANETFGPSTALAAGWTWALFPYFMYWAIRWVWETSLSTFLLSLAFLLALQLARPETGRRLGAWAWFGLLWGAIALSNPSMLSFLPVALVWIGWQLRSETAPRVTHVDPGVLPRVNHVGPDVPVRAAGRSPAGDGAGLVRWLLGAAVALAITTACIVPWMMRNRRVFSEWVFVRSNFGAELRLGNSPAADGLWMWWLHPSQNRLELARYQEMGELEYVRQRGREARAFIRQHPARFVRLCLRRAAYFWAATPRTANIAFVADLRNAAFFLSSVLALWGLVLGIRRRLPGIWLYVGLAIFYPAVYYLTFPHPRYRHAIEPELLIPVVFLFVDAARRERARKESTPA